MKGILVPALAAVVLSGCFTLQETPYPETVMTSVPEGKDVSIQLRGFKARITEYMSVYGYDTVWVGGHPHGRYGWDPGHYHVVPTTAYIPQVSESDVFAQRAKSLAETAGFTTMAQQPDYIVETIFGGPFITDSERGVGALWTILSLLSADYSVQTWTANLKIYDNKTGKLVFQHEYSQRYEVTVWGPLPILSPSGSSKNTYGAIQSWCLTALTDRAMADAASFIVGNTK